MNKPVGEHPHPAQLSNIMGDASFRYIYADNLTINNNQDTSIALGQLSDVDLTTVPPNNGDAIRYDGVTHKWEPSASFITTVKLDDLTDVAITTPATSDLLTYNGTGWVNTAHSSVPISLNDLTDVAFIGNPSNRALLQFNGTTWQNNAPSLSDLSLVVIVSAAAKQVLRFNGTNWQNTQVVMTDLSDTNIGTPATNDFLTWNGTKWVNTAHSAVPIALDDLNDVTIATPATKQVVRYNGTTWVNSQAAMTDLSDTTITTPATSDILTYNGTKWVNTAHSAIPVKLNDLSDVSTGSAVNNDIIRYNGSAWQNIPTLIGGTYTPTLTNVNSAMTVTSTTARYTRIGNDVTLFIHVLVSSGTATTDFDRGFDYDLPVPRGAGNFVASTDLLGVLNGGRQGNSSGYRVYDCVTYAVAGTQTGRTNFLVSQTTGPFNVYFDLVVNYSCA